MSFRGDQAFHVFSICLFLIVFVLSSAGTSFGRFNLPQTMTKIVFDKEVSQVLADYFVNKQSSETVISPDVIEEILVRSLPDDYADACGDIVSSWGAEAEGKWDLSFHELVRTDAWEKTLVLMKLRCSSTLDPMADYYDERLTLLSVQEEGSALNFIPHNDDSISDPKLSKIGGSGLRVSPSKSGPIAPVVITVSNDDPCCDELFPTYETAIHVYHLGRDGVEELARLITSRNEWVRDDSGRNAELVTITNQTFASEGRPPHLLKIVLIYYMDRITNHGSPEEKKERVKSWKVDWKVPDHVRAGYIDIRKASSVPMDIEGALAQLDLDFSDASSYRDDRLGFELQYPGNWRLDRKSGELIMFLGYTKKEARGTFPNRPPKGKSRIQVRIFPQIVQGAKAVKFLDPLARKILVEPAGTATVAGYEAQVYDVGRKLPPSSKVPPADNLPWMMSRAYVIHREGHTYVIAIQPIMLADRKSAAEFLSRFALTEIVPDIKIIEAATESMVRIEHRRMKYALEYPEGWTRKDLRYRTGFTLKRRVEDKHSAVMVEFIRDHRLTENLSFGDYVKHEAGRRHAADGVDGGTYAPAGSMFLTDFSNDHGMKGYRVDFEIVDERIDDTGETHTTRSKSYMHFFEFVNPDVHSYRAVLFSGSEEDVKQVAATFEQITRP